MRDDLFAVPIRKYHLDDNDRFLSFVQEAYNANKFTMPSPYLEQVQSLPAWMTPLYSDMLEGFINDLNVINVLEKGESMVRNHTLPSHYTATHYVSESPDSSDVFYHPAKTLIEAFNTETEDYLSAAGLYVNQGDVIIHPSYIEHSTPSVTKKRMTITLTVSLHRQDERSRESSN